MDVSFKITSGICVFTQNIKNLIILNHYTMHIYAYSNVFTYLRKKFGIYRPIQCVLGLFSQVINCKGTHVDQHTKYMHVS